MARTSDAITAAGAIVREALISAPITRAPRSVGKTDYGTRDGREDVDALIEPGFPTYGGQHPLPLPTASAGVVEIQLTVALADVVDAMSAAERMAFDANSCHVTFAIGLTDAAGELIDNGEAPAYREATGLIRGITTTLGQNQAIRRALGLRPI